MQTSGGGQVAQDRYQGEIPQYRRKGGRDVETSFFQVELNNFLDLNIEVINGKDC